MNPEKDLIPARTEDMIRQSARINSPVYSMFLDEKQCFEAEEVCGKYSDVRYKFWGGYPEAQRKMLCVYSLNGCDYLDELYSENPEQEAPLKCLTFTYRKSDKLSHRDFLGSLMAMRLKRETIGDIVVSEGKTQIFLTDTVSELILGTVSKIGKTGVKICNDIPFDIEKVQEFEYINGTVSSMRADSIISLAIKISREKTSQIIKNAGVQINFSPVFSASYEMKCGDVFSVRGYGRFVLSEITGLSKKGRIRIILKKYK